MLKGIRSYRKLAKKFPVSFSTIREIKLIVFSESKLSSAEKVSLIGDDFEMTENEKSDKILLEALYEMGKYMGLMSKTKAALVLRDILTRLMPLLLKHGGFKDGVNPVDVVVGGERENARQDAWPEALGYCSDNNHGKIVDDAYSRGYREGKARGEQLRDRGVLEYFRRQAFEETTQRGVVPLAVARNLWQELVRQERHIARLCPHCVRILTMEVCEAVFPLSEGQKKELERLRTKKRRLTGEWADPDPNAPIPWFWALPHTHLVPLDV
jgi:hypothetical protein